MGEPGLTDDQLRILESYAADGCEFGHDTVARLVAEVRRLKPAADALAWLDANPALVTRLHDLGWLVLRADCGNDPGEDGVAFPGRTLAEAVGKAMAAAADGA